MDRARRRLAPVEVVRARGGEQRDDVLVGPVVTEEEVPRLALGEREVGRLARGPQEQRVAAELARDAAADSMAEKRQAQRYAKRALLAKQAGSGKSRQKGWRRTAGRMRRMSSSNCIRVG